MRDITQIAIHASATPPSMNIGWAEIKHLHTAPKDELVQWGKKKIPGKAWNDGGYHSVIRRNGRVEAGRPIGIAGAHIRGHNANSYAICIIGGVDEDGRPDFNFTRHQMASLDRLLSVCKNEFPDAEVLGHRDFPRVAKACPCFDVKEWNV